MSSVTILATTASDMTSEWTIPASPWNTSNKIFDNSMGSATNTATLTFGGFAVNQVPVGASIVGIELDAGFWAQTAGTDFCSSVTLAINGHSSSNLDSSTGLGTSSGGSLSYGGPTSFPTGLSGITAADINTGNIAPAFQFSGPGGGSGMSEIFCSGCSVTVYYGPPTEPTELIINSMCITNP